MGEYVLKSITMTLDEASINAAIREVENFQKKLQPAMQCLIDYLGEKGIEIARATLLFLAGDPNGGGENPAYMSGDLSASIKYRNDKGKGVLTAGEGLETEYGSYAMFVEYGTGIIGAENQNPQAAEVGYEYDVHGHGEHGWWYPAPWGSLEADDGNMLAWTAGMAPRPFMFNTLQDLAIEAETSGCKIIAEYIGGERA